MSDTNYVELARLIKVKAGELNSLISEAHERGLAINVKLSERSAISYTYPRPFVHVDVLKSL